MTWLASLRIDFTSWRTVPLLFSSCLALISALDRDAQQPFCYASIACGDQVVQHRPLLDRTDSLRLLALHHGTPVAAVCQLIGEEFKSVRML
jgi:hypothetical protein